MPQPTNASVSGVFHDADQARKAVLELREAGFADDRITVVGRQPRADSGPSGPPTFETGAGMGMLTGASLGGLVTAGLPGLLVGGVAGGLIGSLIDLGIPETDTRFFSDEAAGGGILVVVRGDRLDEAADLLRRNGAQFGGSGAPDQQADRP